MGPDGQLLGVCKRPDERNGKEGKSDPGRTVVRRRYIAGKKKIDGASFNCDVSLLKRKRKNVTKDATIPNVLQQPGLIQSVKVKSFSCRASSISNSQTSQNCGIKFLYVKLTRAVKIFFPPI